MNFPVKVTFVMVEGVELSEPCSAESGPISASGATPDEACESLREMLALSLNLPSSQVELELINTSAVSLLTSAA